MKKLFLAASLVLVGAGCAPAAPEVPTAKVGAPQRPQDAVYVIEGEPVTAPIVFGEPVREDLDDDGDEDAAVLIIRDMGGSGTFYYAAAALQEDWGFQGTEAFFLGDRIAPQTVEARDGLILFNYAERKPGEPMTERASVGVTARFRIENGALVRASP